MTHHHIYGCGLAFTCNWPDGLRYVVVNRDTNAIIDTYQTRHEAEISAEQGKQFYRRYDIDVDRTVFAFMPGMGYYQENQL